MVCVCIGKMFGRDPGIKRKKEYGKIDGIALCFNPIHLGNFLSSLFVLYEDNRQISKTLRFLLLDFIYI